MSQISCHFYCIQPITINNELLLELFSKSIDINALPVAENYAESLPPWFEEFTQIKNSYNAIRLLNQKNPVDIQILVDDLDMAYRVNGDFSLKPFFDTSNSGYYLFFDYRLASFNLVFELTFNFDEMEAKRVTEFSMKNADFYNTVRRLIVKETDASIISHWAENIYANILLTVRELVVNNYGVTSRAEIASILNNTGNITNVVCFNAIKDNDRSQLAKNFVELNTFSERLENTTVPFVIDAENTKPLYTHELYYFNGRFHTILLNSFRDQYRYVPIQFQVQYVWFYIIRLNSILENLNDEIIIQRSHKNLASKEDLIDTLVSRVDILNLFHEGFKFSIEVDYEHIYKQIECRWSIENSLANTNRYISSFKGYLARLQAKKTEKIERKQNKTLFFITIFQFIALLSVWNDYLSLLSHENISKASEIVTLVGSVEQLARVHLYLPLGFITVIALMLVYIYKRNK